MALNVTAEIGANTSLLAQGLRRAETMLVGFSKDAVKQVAGIAAGMASIQTAGAALGAGWNFNLAINNAEVGIANVIKRFKGLNDEAAKTEASNAVEMLKALEPVTAGGMEDLISGFMAVSATGFSAGLTIEEMTELVSLFANSLANAGKPLDQLSQEMRSILTGNIGPDSDIAKILGLTNDAVKEAKQAGTLFQFLKTEIGEFGKAGESANVTFSSFQSAATELIAIPVKPFFDAVVAGAELVTPAMQKVTAALNELRENFSSDDYQGIGKAEEFMRAGEFDKAGIILKAEIKRLQEQLSKRTEISPVNMGKMIFGGITGTGAIGLKETQDMAKELQRLLDIQKDMQSYSKGLGPSSGGTGAVKPAGASAEEKAVNAASARFQIETRILELRAQDTVQSNATADAIQRQLDKSTLIAQIMEQQKISESQAAELAERKLAAEEKILGLKNSNKSDGKPFVQGYTNAQREGSIFSNQNRGLDAHYKRQDDRPEGRFNSFLNSEYAGKHSALDAFAADRGRAIGQPLNRMAEKNNRELPEIKTDSATLASMDGYLKVLADAVR